MVGASAWIRKMFEEGAALKSEYGPDAVFDFSLGNPDLEPPESFFRLLREFSSPAGEENDARDLSASPQDQKTARPKGLHGYTPNAGLPQAREAVAGILASETGIPFTASSILMTAGAAAGLTILFRTILEPGDEVLVFAPYFAEYGAYVSGAGGILRPLPSGAGFLPDPETLASALGSRTRALLVNSPNNPTGRIWPEETFAALEAVLRKHEEATGIKVLVISDEPYRKIVFDGRTAPSPASRCRDTVIATSWSKSLSLAGERIGYLAVSPRLAEAAELVTGLVTVARTSGFVNAPALMQRVASRLAGETVDIGAYERRAKAMSAGLRSAGYEFPEPEGALYVFCKVPEAPGKDPSDPAALESAFLSLLREERILAVPGTGFGCPGWFRLAFCVPESSIINAMPGFARCMEKWLSRS